VHGAAWPAPSAEPAGEAGDPAVLATAAAVLGQVRKAKTAAKLSMRAEAERVVVRGPDEGAVRAAEADLRAAGNITEFAFLLAPDGELSTEVTLAEALSS
jgi:valyl-tRNA synthetase